MKNAHRIALFVLISILPLSSAMAEAEKGDNYVMAVGSYFDDDDDRGVNDGFRGFRLGYGRAIHQSWNLEGYYSRMDPDGSPGQTSTTFGIDLQYIFARDSRFSPYFFLGAGAILRTSERIRGLATAAGVWVTAAIGLLIGLGFWIVGLGLTILALVVIVGLRPLHESLGESEDGTQASGDAGLE